MTASTTFKRRNWTNARSLFSSLSWPFRHRDQLRRAMVDNGIDVALRERLMLAETQVNACRYCSQFHAREALRAGLSEGETRALLAGELGNAPPEELPAVLYAQHWAETDGHPDLAARQRVLAIYGPEQTESIVVVLRMISIGNLAGNTADYWLYRLSFGRFGLTEAEQ